MIRRWGDVLRSIRWHGTDAQKLESVRVGINGRLDSMQCAVVLEKLKIFKDELAIRQSVAAVYERELDGVVGLHAPREGMESGYGLFTVTVERDRDSVVAALKEAGVPSAVYYRMPLHKMAAFARFSPAGGCPVSERLAEHVISLPIHGYMSEEQAARVCAVVSEAVR